LRSEWECYVNKKHVFLTLGGKENEDIVSFNGFQFKSIESLPRPDEALETALQSVPEHDYTGLWPIPFAVIYIIALLYGLFRLVRSRRSYS